MMLAQCRGSIMGYAAATPLEPGSLEIRAPLGGPRSGCGSGAEVRDQLVEQGGPGGGADGAAAVPQV
jgi:hypothetical protein